MPTFCRRDFIRMGGTLAAAIGLGSAPARVLARGLESIFGGRTRVLWLDGMACSGCSVSFLNAENPGVAEIVTQMIRLVFHPTIGATQGQQAIETIQRLVGEGNYILVFEGAVPVGMPEACVLGKQPLAEFLPNVIRNADLVIGAGTCAAFGGIPTADGSVTGAMPLRKFMEHKGLPVAKRLINCPGCPVHPQSIVTTLAYAAGRGYPPVHPERLTPTVIYEHSVHDDCPRFHYWEKEVFARHFGEDGCLFKLGCLGPLSHTNCPKRQWNGGVNWCIRAGAPCTACTSERFAQDQEFPFYRMGKQQDALTIDDVNRQSDHKSDHP